MSWLEFSVRHRAIVLTHFHATSGTIKDCTQPYKSAFSNQLDNIFTGRCNLDIGECDGELDDNDKYAFFVRIDSDLRGEALAALEHKYDTDWSESGAKSQCFENDQVG